MSLTINLDLVSALIVRYGKVQKVFTYDSKYFEIIYDEISWAYEDLQVLTQSSNKTNSAYMSLSLVSFGQIKLY